MKKKSNPISMIVMMAVIGLLISVFSGDFNIGSYFKDLNAVSLKALLDTINLGLAFLALAGVFIVLIVRAARKDKEYFWDFTKDDIQEDEEK